jgi:hypothetical protein
MDYEYEFDDEVFAQREKELRQLIKTQGGSMFTYLSKDETLRRAGERIYRIVHEFKRVDKESPFPSSFKGSFHQLALECARVISEHPEWTREDLNTFCQTSYTYYKDGNPGGMMVKHFLNGFWDMCHKDNRAMIPTNTGVFDRLVNIDLIRKQN